MLSARSRTTPDTRISPGSGRVGNPVGRRHVYAEHIVAVVLDLAGVHADPELERGLRVAVAVAVDRAPDADPGAHRIASRSEGGQKPITGLLHLGAAVGGELLPDQGVV